MEPETDIKEIPAQAIWPERAISDQPNWYLLLQIGFPEYSRVSIGGVVLRRDLKPAERHLAILRCECKPIGVQIRSIGMRIGSGPAQTAHYLFRFENSRRDDARATRLAEAIAYGMTLTSGLFVDTNEPLVLPVPETMVRRKRNISLESLLNLERSRPWRNRTLRYPDDRIAMIARTVTRAHEVAWKIASVTLMDGALFDATRFLHRSHQNFSVSPGGIDEVLYDDQSPATGTSQNNFEDALHSAFKAIEAVIGDPPKDDRRLFAKLEAIGIDPHEEVGYREAVPIEKMIRRMNEARDKRAAHGSTRNRTIAAPELLEFQACAEVIVIAAIEKKRGSPL